MSKKLNLDDILDKYIIVVDGDEKKVVYDVDDSRIFSVSITGCGRGARNAVLSEDTFKTLEDAEKGIKYLDTCYWNFKFKAIKVSKLKNLSIKGWNILVEDINHFNMNIDFQNEINCKREEENSRKRLELKMKAISLIETMEISSISTEDGETVITLWGV